MDGYVWETLSSVEPSLTSRTRIVTRSDWLGFPPFAALSSRAKDPAILRFTDALRGLDASESGRAALGLLFLDRIQQGDTSLFDGIALRMAELTGG